MKIAVVKETHADEPRVAATPDSVKAYLKMGFDVQVEKGAGVKADITDEAYQEAGATVTDTPFEDADVILAVRAPKNLLKAKENAVICAQFSPYDNTELLDMMAKQKLSSLSLELMPRITRAQSMDVLSSQSNLAGYKAVLEAANAFGRAFPMMMTAAGTIPPARVLVLGAGVAGLQAIATAKRLGAIVHAFDVRAAAAEQVESLGGKFISVEQKADAETSGGYAKEMDDDYKQRQRQAIIDALKKTDIVITTALIPGKKAPILLDDEMLLNLKTGSVVVDIAAERGGNCSLTKPGNVLKTHGITIIGYNNIAGRLAADASRLYAKNVLTLVQLLKTEDGLEINLDDEIIQGILLTHQGEIVHANFKQQKEAA